MKSWLHWKLYQTYRVQMASFAPKAGCPMCSIVATASHTTPNSPRSPIFPPGSTQAEVLWRDDNLTAYREKANPVSSKGHIIIAFKYIFSPILCSAQLNQKLYIKLYIACMCHHYTLLYVPGILLPTLSLNLILAGFLRRTSTFQCPKSCHPFIGHPYAFDPWPSCSSTEPSEPPVSHWIYYATV